MCTSVAHARSRDLQLEAEEMDAPFITDELDRQDTFSTCSSSGAAQSAWAMFPLACQLQRYVLDKQRVYMCIFDQRRYLSSLCSCSRYLLAVGCRLTGHAMPSWSVKEQRGIVRLHREQLLERRRGAMAAKRGRAAALPVPLAASNAPRAAPGMISLSRNDGDAAGTGSLSPTRSAPVRFSSHLTHLCCKDAFIMGN